MTIELITSQAYVDNIRNFLPEKTNSKFSPLEKSNKIFTKIINSKYFIFDETDTRITNNIKTLLSIRPGRSLFKRLLEKANKRLKFVFTEEKSCFSSKRKIINIVRNDSGNSHYSYCVNSRGEKMLAASSEVISLAHELVHALHYFEDSRELREEKKKKAILASDLGNFKEQETIIGKEEEGSLCENLFRSRFGYPLRLNHRGFWLKREETFTSSTLATHGALVNLKVMLSSNDSLINLPQLSLNSKYANVEMTPLNASIVAQQVEISNYLFQIGADVNAKDGYWGTALHAAIHTKQYDMVNLLLKHGAAVDVKDPYGRTALKLASELKDDKARALLAPSIFRRALRRVGSLVYFLCKSLLFDPLFALRKSLVGAFPFSR